MNRPHKFGLLALAPVWGAFAFCGAQELESEEAWLDSLLGGDMVPGEMASQELSSALGSLSMDEKDTPDASSDLDGDVAAGSFLDGYWDMGSSASFGSGFGNNVLLSEDGSVDSVFAQLEGEFFAMGAEVLDRYDVAALLYGEFKYYEDVPGVEVESLSLAQISVMTGWGASLDVGGFVEGIYSVQAFDASLNDFELDADAVRSWRPKYGVRAKRFFANGMQLEGELYRGGARYEQSSEDFDDHGFGLNVSGDLGEASRFEFELLGFQERYRERVERLSLGSLQEAGLLEISGFGVRAAWRRSYEHPVLKGVAARAYFEEEDDAEGDYYGRYKWEFRPSVDLELVGWAVSLSVAYEEVAYDARRASILSEVLRSDDAWRWRVEGAKLLGDGCELFFRLEGTDKASNAAELSYETSGGALGVRFYGVGES